MKKTTISFIIVLALLFTSNAFSQNLNSLKNDSQEQTSYLNSVLNKKLDLNSNKKLMLVNPATAKTSLGVNVGFANIEKGTGIALGLFAEVRLTDFSFVPQANYWKVNDMTNFELAAIARMRFKSVQIEPYIDGGLGLNFLTLNVPPNNRSESITKLSIDVGGGIELLTISPSYSLIFDAKYKIIIKDEGNIDGFVVTGGIKFPMNP
ncbi:MAG TPA: hypothetical protein VHP32_09100 [Ignavibacteria bacterium]|nr:hypothetical protein [Ignavibacteria bacterium]